MFFKQIAESFQRMAAASERQAAAVEDQARVAKVSHEASAAASVSARLRSQAEAKLLEEEVKRRRRHDELVFADKSEPTP